MDQKLIVDSIQQIIQSYSKHLRYIENLGIDSNELSLYIQNKKNGLLNYQNRYQFPIDQELWEVALRTLNPSHTLTDVYNDYLRIEPGLVQSAIWKENRDSIIAGFESIVPALSELDKNLRILRSEMN